jgi:hypothetical protein
VSPKEGEYHLFLTIYRSGGFFSILPGWGDLFIAQKRLKKLFPLQIKAMQLPLTHPHRMNRTGDPVKNFIRKTVCEPIARSGFDYSNDG